MLAAYYDKSCDSRELFRGLKAEQAPSFETYLNKYYVIRVDMTDFTTRFRGEKNIVSLVQQRIMDDVLEAFPDINPKERDDLMEVLFRISDSTGERFVIIIDECSILQRLPNTQATSCSSASTTTERQNCTLAELKDAINNSNYSICKTANAELLSTCHPGVRSYIK